MVSQCALCKFRHKNSPNSNIQLHQIPKDENAYKKWIEALNVDSLSKTGRICSQHFKSEDFNRAVVTGKRILKPNAIPSINIIINDLDIVKKEIDDEKLAIDETKEIQVPVPVPINKRGRLKRDFDEEDCIPLKNVRHLSDINVDKVSQSQIEAKACIEVLLSYITDAKKENRLLRLKNNRLQNKVKNLKILISSLKDHYGLSTPGRKVQERS